MSHGHTVGGLPLPPLLLFGPQPVRKCLPARQPQPARLQPEVYCHHQAEYRAADRAEDGRAIGRESPVRAGQDRAERHSEQQPVEDRQPNKALEERRWDRDPQPPQDAIWQRRTRLPFEPAGPAVPR